MKKQTPFQIFIFLILLSGKLISQSVTPTAPNGLPLYQDGKLYFQIKLTSNVVVNNKDTIVNDPGGSFHTLFIKYQVTKTERPYAILNTPELNKSYRITFNQPARIDSFILELSQISTHVQYAEKVPAIYTFLVPNDPVYTMTPSPLYHLSLLNANQASNIHISNGNAVVAIVDDAVLTSHEDLAANIYSLNVDVTSTLSPTNPNPPLSAGNASNFTHGTHVAGIAGAVTNNSVGVASIGWNNSLMGVKTSDGSVPGSLQDPFGGVAWAVTHGAHVINMSWGGYVPSQTDYNVIVAAKNNNVVLVGAVGNDNISQANYPSAYGEGTTGQSWEVLDHRLVVAVAALDQNNNKSLWPTAIVGLLLGSNYGSWVDIAAYGTDIMSTLAASTSTGSAINNQYGLENGTSMAAPMVSGIVGIMRSYNMSKTANDVIDCLLNMANPDIYGSSHPGNIPGTLGSGRADAAAALRCISSDCSVSPVAIIVPSPSSSLCAGTTITLTAVQGGNSYLWNTGATTQTIAVNTPGTYSVIATYPSHCTATAAINIPVPPTISLSLSTNTSICSFSVNMISASGNYTALVWQPGALTTNSIAVTPTANMIYTVTANPQCGGTTATIAVNSNGNGTVQPLSSNVYGILGSTLVGTYMGVANPQSGFSYVVGYYMLPTDAIVNTNATLLFASVLCAANVKLTVPTGSTLNISRGMMQTCSNNMWTGIVVQDGAQVITTNQSTIEDAVTAISSTHTPAFSAGIPPGIIWAQGTAFNRNYIDISLINYYDFISGPVSYSNSLKVEGCLFTCRAFALDWPSAGSTTTVSGGLYITGMRAATASTTGLIPPYGFYGTPTGTLKAPYTGQTSRYAILLSSSASTNNVVGNDFVIGNDIHPSYFNLFDNHIVFINSLNNNVTLKNNVFENQVNASIGTSMPGQLSVPSPAILHCTNTNLNTALDLTASSPPVGNRFWNCYKAIDARNAYRFNITNGIFRSTQSSTNVPTYSSGNTGIQLKTDRFQYYMANNEFSNIANAINIPVIAGSYTASGGAGTSSGIYASNITVLQNTFSPGSGSNNYMNQAVNIDCVNSTPMSVATNSSDPTSIGIRVEQNQLNNVFRGVRVNGFQGLSTSISQNTLSLATDNVFSVEQHGLELENSLSTSTLGGLSRIFANVATGSGTAAITNSLASLVYNSLNLGFASPSVTCNDVSNSYNGFTFYGQNTPTATIQGTRWHANKMQTLAHGMLLDHSGKIGQQGSSSWGTGNQWNSTWPTGTNGIYTNTSVATQSPIYVVGSSSPSYPPNLSGFPFPQSYGTGGINTTTSSAYLSCSDAAADIVPGSIDPQYGSSNIAYMSNSNLYRFLRYNAWEKSAHSDLNDFYNAWNSSDNSIKLFALTEEYLYAGNYSSARSVLSSITATNAVETNYKNLYRLHANYLEAVNTNTTYSSDDAASLSNLAALCPGENGNCIYQARALYNAIFNTVVNYSDGCSTGGSGRLAHYDTDQPPAQKPPVLKKWDVELFPNPASGQLSIVSQQPNDDLHITITDLTGRTLLQQSIKPNGFIANLELALINGSYLITVTSSDNKAVTKKLLIAK